MPFAQYNVLQQSYVTWQSDPSVRGTFDIISTCISTLLVCVWSAVHIGIPENPKSPWSLRQKFQWMVIGILAPDYVAYIAYSELRTAVMLRDAANRYLKDTPVWIYLYINSSSPLSVVKHIPVFWAASMDTCSRLLCLYGWICLR